MADEPSAQTGTFSRNDHKGAVLLWPLAAIVGLCPERGRTVRRTP